MSAVVEEWLIRLSWLSPSPNELSERQKSGSSVGAHLATTDFLGGNRRVCRTCAGTARASFSYRVLQELLYLAQPCDFTIDFGDDVVRIRCLLSWYLISREGIVPSEYQFSFCLSRARSKCSRCALLRPRNSLVFCQARPESSSVNCADDRL